MMLTGPFHTQQGIWYHKDLLSQRPVLISDSVPSPALPPSTAGPCATAQLWPCSWRLQQLQALPSLETASWFDISAPHSQYGYQVPSFGIPGFSGTPCLFNPSVTIL
ncbi:hypothetical protein LEMLEM_LOCUS11737 [Lemmus lemmus]